MIKKSVSLVIGIVMVFMLFPIAISGSTKEPELSYQAITDGKLPELNYTSAMQMIEEMESVAQVGKYKLFWNKQNATFAVENTQTRAITTSNPYNAAQSTEFVGNIRNSLLSQIVIEYTDSTSTPYTLWSAGDCVAINQISYAGIDNGISVKYSLGKEQNQLVIPEVITESHFKSDILENIEDQYDRESITYFYRLVSLDGISSDSERSELLKQYPYLEKENLYCLLSSLSDNEKSRLNDKLEKADYTLEKRNSEYKLLSYQSAQTSSANFQLTVNYTLTESGLTVDIPADAISFDKNSFHLKDIELLPYFGAEVYDGTRQGYLFLPDGSGTVLPYSLNTLSEKQSAITTKLYGTDCSVSYPQTPWYGYSFCLPVYGINNGGGGLFSIVEDGSGLCSISSRMAGGKDYIYTSYPVFTYVANEQMALEAKVNSAYSTRDVTVYDKNAYTGHYTVHYSFLEDGKSSYSDMAQEYRGYLKERRKVGDYNKDSLSLQIETLGTVQVSASFFGLPYKKAVNLTTYEQDREILEAFRKAGISDLSLCLEAWRKAGFDAGVCNKFDPAANLGGKSGLSELSEWCTEQNIAFYPMADFIFTSTDHWFDGFNATQDATRLLNSKYGGLLRVRPDMSTYDENTFRYSISPDCYQKYMTSFFKQYSKNDFSSVCLSYAGQYLNSNFKAQRLTNREQTLDRLSEQIDAASKDNELTFNGANAYVLPYASYLFNLPAQDSGLTSTSKSVPFIQLVLNGMVGYSSEPLNFSENLNTAILRCIETKSSPSFTIAYDNVDQLKKTVYTRYYSVDYSRWAEKAAEAYHKIESALKDVQSATMTAHEYLSDQVVRVTYSNGKYIMINYGDTPYTADGNTVEPNSFCTVTQ